MGRTQPNSEDAYSMEEAIQFVKDADVGEYRGVTQDNAFCVTYEGFNRQVFIKHLLEHGWAVTSVSSKNAGEGKADIWFERVGNERGVLITSTGSEVWVTDTSEVELNDRNSGVFEPLKATFPPSVLHPESPYEPSIYHDGSVVLYFSEVGEGFDVGASDL